MTSAMDDARRSPSTPRRRSFRAVARRLVVRGGLVVTTVVVGLAWPLRFAEWGSPEVAAFLLAVGFATLVSAVWHGTLAFAASRRHRGEPPRLAHDAARRPAATEAWLHVVSGPDRARVAETVVAVAGDLLAHGGRVVVMDAGRRLRLHELFGREPRWGVGECLAGALPLLGLVQDTGVSGLYLVAHGAAVGADDWPHLPRVLDDARPHFARCVLALDATVPHEAGEALAGRYLEGWWAAPGPLSKNALAFSERTGIPLTAVAGAGGIAAALGRLGHGPSAPPSLPAARPQRAAARIAEAPDMTITTAALDHEPSLPVVVDLPSILDGDVRVRERLRFLVWAKSLRPGGGPPMPARAS